MLNYSVAELRIYKDLFIHIGYKLHDFHDPNNLMLGLGWRFGNGRQH